MKRILTSLLLLLLIIWSGGMVQVTCLRILARLKAANIASCESPEVWVFNESELRNAAWEDDGEEFVISGRLFDVLYVEKTGETKNYHCYFDHFETNVAVAGDESSDAFLNHPLPHKDARGKVPLLSLDLFFERPQLFSCQVKNATEADFPAFNYVASRSIYLDVPLIPPKVLNS